MPHTIHRISNRLGPIDINVTLSLAKTKRKPKGQKVLREIISTGSKITITIGNKTLK